jgi:hypothetical protein
MTANELRIGNYVRSISIDYIVWKIDGSGNIQGVEGGTSFNLDRSTEPILLTEDWLVKLGFEEGSIALHSEIFMSKHHSYTNYWIRLYRWEGSYLLHIGFGGSEPYFIRRVEYVHSLQNIYYELMQEELTLNENP